MVNLYGTNLFIFTLLSHCIIFPEFFFAKWFKNEKILIELEFFYDLLISSFNNTFTVHIFKEY